MTAQDWEAYAEAMKAKEVQTLVAERRKSELDAKSPLDQYAADCDRRAQEGHDAWLVQHNIALHTSQRSGDQYELAMTLHRVIPTCIYCPN